MNPSKVSAGRILLAPDSSCAWPRIFLWLQRQAGTLRRWWQKPGGRELRLCESLALGEHRFLALVACGNRRFLIGGAGSSVGLLAELPPEPVENLKGESERAR